MRGSYEMNINQVGDFVVARLTVDLGKGASLAFQAKVAIEAIANLLGTSFRGQFGVAGTEVGFLGKLFKKVKKVARKVAKNKVFQAAKAAFRNPIFKGIAMGIPGVNVAVGALTAADMAMQAAGGVAKMIKGGAPKQQIMAARQKALQLKKVAARQARARKVPFEQFSSAWASGWDSVPDPREIAQLKALPKASNVSAMYRQGLQQATRGFTQALPNVFQQFA